MNRYVLGVGLLLVAAVATYPPYFFTTPGVPESRSNTDRHPLWEQPQVNSTRQIDWSRLAAELVVVTAATFGIAALAGRRVAGPVKEHVQ